ncbi:MAG TPA: SDR family oxidoreductase [Kofleriaceae bacterium]|jgi:NAD(P)-dependent dehydrogenase (short-subunit alcohol dehydrogenase family)|nr:SDR family oxidoreductase [Kofleriaceae bacterium]
MAKICFVTGGAHGIGKATAERFATAGYRVATADINHVGVDYRLDVADDVAVARVIDDVAKAFGGIDVVINNAGIADPGRTSIDDLSVTEWRRVIDVNLSGMFFVAKAAAPHLRKRKGCIVNTTSTRAFMSEPNTFAYSASKGGIVALTHSLAISLGPDVRVNAIAPGWIATHGQAELRERDHAFHPVGRVGTPDDIAGLALFLTSEDAGFITGEVITSDGGVTRKMIYPE